MADASTFAKIKIGIASPEEIRAWSYGEVKKPETINYRTFKPERDGLFCERIFGPVKDWECHCGRYKKMKFKGVICERCGVEVTRSKVRRERMGHIELAAPVCHVWYLKAVPSPLGLILDMSPRHLERVLYFQAYIVIDVDEVRIAENLSEIRAVVAAEEEKIRQEGAETRERRIQEFNREVQRRRSAAASDDPEVAAEGWSEEIIARKRADLEVRLRHDEEDVEFRIQDLRNALAVLEKVKPHDLITEDQYRALENLQQVLAYHFGDNSWYEVVRAGQGGAAIKELLQRIDLEQLKRELRQEVENTQGPKRVRATKRLELVEAFLASRTRPEWMILEAVPVISPELRPMVMLEGGRFAASDLNDLYRRIINRNNRLKRIIEIRAPESIVNHEKRLLQEAVDALIDNSRRQRPVLGSNGRPLKSLSDMLKGKEGRFRKNLLGKRVDYSGRSVIVVGPHLKLHQCGLPKEMALELFKPFVMKTLVEHGYTTNIKTAKRMIEKAKPEVWDALEEVIREHPVLLNRAPTLHRLGIQAFEPILIEGKAIQIHPLVCYAFNADFDGDQMAVHVPLSAYAQAEARILMLSSHNLFSPAHGGPIVAPTQDIVLGCYYLTMMRMLKEGEEPRNYVFSSPDEALLAYSSGELGLHDPITLKMPRPFYNDGDDTPQWRQEVVGLVKGSDGQWRYRTAEGWQEVPPGKLQEAITRHCTTVGRLIFNQILPEKLRYADAYLFNTMNKSALAELVSTVYDKHGKERCVQFLDEMKSLGFKYAMKGGITIAMTDMDSPSERDEIIRRAEERVREINQSYDMGMLSAAERKRRVLEEWLQASDDVAKAIMKDFDEHNQFNPIYIITNSGARGSTKQVAQLSGMRGLMTDPFGNLIEDLPIKSNFHEGLKVLEFFVSTHGARKGMADTALRTADAGYLTRRLVDVSQDVIVRDKDCGTTEGIEVEEILDGTEVLESLSERIRGRYTLSEIEDPLTGEILVGANEEISDAVASRLEQIRVARDTILDAETKEVLAHEGDLMTVEQAQELVDRGVTRARAKRGELAPNIYEITRSLRVPVRSVLNCELRQGVCAHCYGRDLATGRLVEIGVAVGIIAAQSIGEPGTQLTMRTFHTGGVAGKYLTGVANVKQRRQSTLRELHDDIQKGIVNLEETGGSERERRASIQAMLKVLEDQVRGLLRVSELFEARSPKGRAIVTEYAGDVVAIRSEGARKVYIRSEVELHEDQPHYGLGTDPIAGEDIFDPETGEPIAKMWEPLADKQLRKIFEAGLKRIKVLHSYLVPYRGDLAVEEGQHVERGDRLTDGPLDPHKVLELQGPRGVQDYLVREIQAVYKAQGVDINDKHIEVIVRQMLRKRKVRHPGDTRFLIGQIVDKFVFQDENARVRKLGLREATADWVLLSITDAALATESFLSAASFQKTTRVLTDAAVRGKKDELVGLKENVIIGRLIPAGTGLPHYRSLEVAASDGTPIIIEPPKREAERLAKALPEESAELPKEEPERYTPEEAVAALKTVGAQDSEDLHGDTEPAEELQEEPKEEEN
ncbi:DNA-directed RNA polymerase subunit beta' [Chthonomonas calidirosea]|uniref:DNA-directed RNA polymerase subunit beta' n=1 Tax=Chthonomonas calidirosea TaxID=454171 RepID=UPI0006DD3FF9|nr:DNA-directed RNA polymerase subunit beta' [Chthonomonas calidirosea]CEK16676.1 DNA-directed RNA polymerase subunit beta' [Chthonomonas calidirosea]